MVKGAQPFLLLRTITPAVRSISYGEPRHKRMPLPSGLQKTTHFQKTNKIIYLSISHLKLLIVNPESKIKFTFALC